MEYNNNNNNNNNNNLFSIRYSNTLSYTNHMVLLYNIGINKIENSRLLVFVYNKIVKVGPPVHNYEHEAGSYGDGFT